MNIRIQCRDRESSGAHAQHSRVCRGERNAKKENARSHNNVAERSDGRRKIAPLISQPEVCAKKESAASLGRYML